MIYSLYFGLYSKVQIFLKISLEKVLFFTVFLIIFICVAFNFTTYHLNKTSKIFKSQLFFSLKIFRNLRVLNTS